MCLLRIDFGRKVWRRRGFKLWVGFKVGFVGLLSDVIKVIIRKFSVKWVILRLDVINGVICFLVWLSAVVICFWGMVWFWVVVCVIWVLIAVCVFDISLVLKKFLVILRAVKKRINELINLFIKLLIVAVKCDFFVLLFKFEMVEKVFKMLFGFLVFK